MKKYLQKKNQQTTKNHETYPACKVFKGEDVINLAKMGQTQRQTRSARRIQKAKKMKEGKECENKTKDRHTNKACCSFQPSKKADVHCLLRELGEELTMT